MCGHSSSEISLSLIAKRPAEINRGMGELMAGYNEKELALIQGFFERANATRTTVSVEGLESEWECFEAYGMHIESKTTCTI